MPRIRTVLASAAVAAVAATGLLAAPAPAQAAWKKLDCAPTEVRGAKICIYRDKQITNLAMYKYVNRSSFNLKHITRFWRKNSSATYSCGQTTTRAGHTTTCLKSVAPGRYYGAADTWKGDAYLGFTATDTFRFGQTG